MKILFVICQLDFADHIAIAYLSAIAKQLGHSTYFCSLDSDNLVSKIREVKPNVVAYSVNIMGYEQIIEEHKKAKQVHKFVSIMGGPQATFSPETFPESGMDTYCVGEGEYAFRDFLIKVESGESFDNVPNLITRDKENKIITNPVRNLIENLDELPISDRDLTISNSFLKDTPKKTFYTTRGCPFECSYCLPRGTLVLTDELTYVPIENIKIGDTIIGVNEDAAHTKFCSSKVLNTFKRTAKIYEIKTMNGSVCSTEEHPWLSNHKRWIKTKNLKPGHFLRRVSLPIKTPFETKDYKLGYIAGSYDGDGSIIRRKVVHPWGIYDGHESSLPSMITDIIPGDVRDVYNLETSTQNFVANGFVTHNCCNNYYHQLYKGKGPVVRRFSVERIINEIEDVKSKYRTDFIKFEDDLFAAKADDWLEEFAEKYPRRIGVPFNCYLRFDLVNDDILKLLKKAGCYSVHLSVDSTSQYVRENILKRRMKKGMDSDHIISALKKIKEYGINTWVNYMLAIPESTLQDDLDTIKLSNKANVTYTAYSTTVPMKGTELCNYCIDKQITDSAINKGDMTGCSLKSTLSCFTEKEKNIRYNIYLLGPITSRLPSLLYRVSMYMIKNVPPNILFKKIRDYYFGYSITHTIFKLRKD